MGYDAHDAAMDTMYEKIGDELYPEHRSQAISDFTTERLRSFYIDNPHVMRPAVDALLEAQKLYENGHSQATVVFAVSCTEMMFKETLLRPVVYGLVHIESLAESVVENTLSGTGYKRYTRLLSRLFTEFVGIDIQSVRRPEGQLTLLQECEAQLTLRNKIVHQGVSCSAEQARNGLDIAAAVFNHIVTPMLHHIGLTVEDRGEIRVRRYA
jgi:hypothetical protein